jgi:hypothetical protein
MMTCERLAPFYEKFALGVLEGKECAEIEAHLARACPKCKAGVARARWVVVQRTLAAPDAQIQAALRAKFMDTAKMSTGAARTGVPTAEAKPKPSPQHSIFPAWAWTAAVALALFTGYTIRQMSNQNDQLAQLRKQMKLASMQNQSLQTQLDIDHMVAMIMVSPDSMSLKLTPKDNYMPVMHAYLHPHMGMAITAAEMPSMPSVRTLQLWLLQKTGKPVSAAIFHPDAVGQIALVAPLTLPLSEITALAVSEEPAGGSAQPTAPISWMAQTH